MSAHLAAALFTAFIALVFTAGFGTALWLDISAQIDRAVRLPEHPRPRVYPVPAPRPEPATERVEPVLSLADFPRRGANFEEYL